MGQIIDITAMEVLDSRGNPTVQAEVFLDSGISAKAVVPSGASTGEREALELRDGGTRYHGKGVLKAVGNILKKIGPKLRGLDSREQVKIDNIMIGLDGTENKKNLGANAILGVSLAICRASAIESGMPLYRYIGGCNAKELPVPMMNILNGGAHADNNLDIQEFMIMPAGLKNFSSAVRAGSEVMHTLKAILKKKGLSTAVGDEGGFAPDLKNNEEAIKLILQAIEAAGYKPGKDIYVALDVAASELYNGKGYSFDNKTLSSDDMISYYENITKKYPVLSIEDGLSEKDWGGWKNMTKRLGKQVQLVGDDVFVTNTEIFSKGISEGLANSILIKLNQIGTVTETLDAVEMAKEAGYTAIISHRSGESEDTTIADLAVAYNTGFIKTGSMARSERVSKYNRLMEIETELSASALYKGLGGMYNLSK